MPIPISLQEFVDQMDTVSDQEHVYVNRVTGEFYSLSADDIAYAEGDEDEKDAPEWQRELIQKAKEILERDNWVELPGRFEINEWQIMADFAQSQTNDALGESLLRAVHGKGAFRYFKDVVYREGIKEEWFRYRTEAFAQIAEKFLTGEKIPYKKDVH